MSGNAYHDKDFCLFSQFHKDVGTLS